MRSIALPVVCLVTDRRRLSPDARTLTEELTALERLIDDAIAAGIDMIQIREAGLETASLVALVQRVCRRASDTRTNVIVNDRVDVALIAGAAGVHLPSHGIPVAGARHIVGSRMMGCSTHPDTTASTTIDADYAIFGTVFETRSKPGRSDTAGLTGLTLATRTFQVPVFAIGGVTPARAADCVRAGAAGIAAIAPFLSEGREPGAIGTARAIAAFREAMADGWQCPGPYVESGADLLE